MMSVSKELGFEFVTGSRPDQLKVSSRRTKSYVSKRNWKAWRESKTDESKTPKNGAAGGKVSVAPHRRPLLVDVFEGIPTSRAIPQRDPSTLLLPAIEYQLGGGRMDPFMSYPGKHCRLIEGLMDHYVTQMAVDIPELDGPNASGLLRTRWFPLALSQPPCFFVIILLAACNLASVGGATGYAPLLLDLKAQALQSLSVSLLTYEKLGLGEQATDGLIGAIAKMASFEAMHGEVVTYHLHMRALCRIIEDHGGLDRLGLCGLLSRIVLWIDVNSAFLLKTDRYFPQECAMTTHQEPNPQAFIAAGPGE